MAEPLGRHDVGDVAEVIAIIADPATSYWLRDAIVSACARDPFDAERDAMTLAALLTRRLDAIVARHFPSRR
ncbi:hypothetical protein [Sphingomonas solaris]|uniref:Uncharacterized protein n=1 Tax=Alterirhizorhabdus solaris TaxID=2529389 RepID=A0A558R2P5_9SPHN|nr:hypothetical protein [Sphingomonas solaris]TVV73646.1 hypothetical protein FOY91_11815 [Sphingomonas solaris]